MIFFKTKYGKTSISRQVFSRIVAEEAARYGDRFMLTNYKGKPVRIGRTGRESLSFVEVREIPEHNAVDLKLYATVKFGVSIRRLTAELAAGIRSESLIVTGVAVNEITVMITGVRSKRTARRELEVRC